MKLSTSQGHPEDLLDVGITPTRAKQDGWISHRFNGLFGPWRHITQGAADWIKEWHDISGERCMVTLLGFPLPYGKQFDAAVRSAPERGQFIERVGLANLEALRHYNLTDRIVLDIDNGPERLWATTYRGRTLFPEAEGAYQTLIDIAMDMDFVFVRPMRRHIYMHRTNAAVRDMYEDSVTTPLYDEEEQGVVPLVTECGVHVTVKDRADALRFLLRTRLWDAQGIAFGRTIHAPYQKNDGAGYGGLWYDDETNAVLKEVMGK